MFWSFTLKGDQREADLLVWVQTEHLFAVIQHLNNLIGWYLPLQHKLGFISCSGRSPSSVWNHSVSVSDPRELRTVHFGCCIIIPPHIKTWSRLAVWGYINLSALPHIKTLRRFVCRDVDVQTKRFRMEDIRGQAGWRVINGVFGEGIGID